MVNTTNITSSRREGSSLQLKATAQPQPGANVDEVLSAILESPNFTVADYLNTALYDVIETEETKQKNTTNGPYNDTSVATSTTLQSTSSLSSSSSTVLIHRLTELAVSLQMETQRCHDTISQVGMELQSILVQPQQQQQVQTASKESAASSSSSRCMNDIQRLQASYTNLLQNECQQLQNDCFLITGGNNNSNGGTTGNAVTSFDTTPTNTKDHNTMNRTTSGDATTVASTPPPNASAAITTKNATTMAMETLGTLHALYTNLHRTKEIIIAIHVWDTTINAISNYIVQHNTNDAVQCLLSLQQSERTLRGMTTTTTTGERHNHPNHPQQLPTAEQRTKTLEKLQLQVTTLLLQPNLQEALSVLPQYRPISTNTSTTDATDSTTMGIATTPTITTAAVIADGGSSSSSSSSGSIGPIQQCVQLYRQLDQFSIFIHEYVQQRPIPIHKVWFDTYHPSVAAARTTTTSLDTVDNDGTPHHHHHHPMLLWLPNYYDHLLQYIHEERRLCEQIFTVSPSHHSHHPTTPTSAVVVESSGTTISTSATAITATTIPSILIQIVQECFRPNIISSFVARLHTIYNPTTTNNNNNDVSSFAMIATLYESTIQFLSLLYQSIMTTYMDMIESSSSKSPSGVSKNNTAEMELYRNMTVLFLTIVSPFREYQGKHYHTIELQFLQTTALQPHVKSIQQVTKHLSNANLSVEILQETMDQLHAVTMTTTTTATTMFQMLELSLQRYELLNGGYYSVDTIQMIDTQVLYHYINEIAITVHSISAHIVQNDDVSQQFIALFEEQHVSIALQILFVVHAMIRSVQQLEQATGEMMIRLHDRVRNYCNKEERMKIPSTSSSFQLSESLSMVEINTIVTNNVVESIENDNDGYKNKALQETITTLRRLTTTTTTTTDDPPQLDLYPATREIVQHKLLLSCHTFVFDICYAIPRYYLSSIGSYKSWKSIPTNSSDNYNNNNEYGTLPQEYMTHIGEHMLALVQALEPFAMNTDYLQQVKSSSGSATRDVAMNPKYIRRVVQPIWIDVLSAIQTNNDKRQRNSNELAMEILMHGTDLIDYVLGDVVIIQPNDDDGEEPDQADDNDDETNAKEVTLFCNTWLDVISSAVTGRLIERILRIPLLSNQGCEHIQADLGYIVNVLTALGITGHPHPLLTHIATLAMLDESVLRERQDAMALSNSTQTPMAMNLIQAIEQRFIAMRSFG